MSDELHELHQAANDTLLGRLHSGLLGLRSGAGDFSPPAEAPSERALVPADAAQAADAGRDSDGCEGTQGEEVEA